MLPATQIGKLAVTGAILSLVIASHALAQCEQAQLTASDAARQQYFGRAVSISGDVAVIGAPGDASAGTNTGAAYVFRRVGPAWVQEQKLIASDALEGDQFGGAVAVGGDTAMVTAFQADTVLGNVGAVYVFRWDGVRWVERQKLLAPDAFLAHQLGWSVSIDVDVAAVGQIGDSFAGNPESGAVYVFRWNGSSWVPEQKLTPPDLGYFDHFGFSVSVSGTVIVSGAPQQTPFGAVYVFRWDGASWIQEQKVTASDSATPDSFGRSVATYQDVLIAGVPNHNGAFVGSGLAYAYRFDASSWGDEQKLNPPTEVQYGSFGRSVAVLGNRLLAGATGGGARGPASGAVYLYTLNGARWAETLELRPTDAQASSGFGNAVSLAPDGAIIGAPGTADACPGDPSCGSGSAYIYDIDLCMSAIPAISTWGLAALGLSLLGIGALLVRRKPVP